MAEEKDDMLEQFRDAAMSNPKKALADIFETSLYHDDLDSLFSEVTRLGMDPEQFELAFGKYALYHRAVSVSAPEVEIQNWPTHISVLLRELHKRRQQEKKAAINISPYTLTSEAVHLAYMGFIEKTILEVTRECQTSIDLLVHLGPHDLNLKDVLNVQKLNRKAGLTTENSSYKELIQENLEETFNEKKWYLDYLDLLEAGAQDKEYEFKLPLVLV